MRPRSIVIAGVGGQGLLTMGSLLGEALLRQGYRVSVGEVHGLSQRGGSVVVFVRYAEYQPSPVVAPGEGDVLVGLELIEAARRLHLLSRSGLAVVNDFLLPPPAAQKVPSREELVASIGKAVKSVFVEALPLAEKAGSPVAVNMVMLGALAACSRVDVSLDSLRNVVAARFRGAVGAVNVRALELGYEEALKKLREQVQD
uniref:Indolepyruvate oxidoreductase subunit beta n=1 Tax=Thermofilum pendens TaxID=2269 RepID=A0A7C1T102_THEPE